MNVFISGDVDIVYNFEQIYEGDKIEVYKIVMEDMNKKRHATKYCIITPKLVYECRDEAELLQVFFELLQKKQKKEILN